MKRLEFSKPVKIQMFRRAGGPDDLRCEGCGLRLMGKPFDYDHTIEEWERLSRELKRKPLTAEDGKLLGYCCHKPKTAKKSGERAHGVRIVENAARVNAKPPPRYIKKMNGTVVDRQTGEVVRGRR